MGTVGIGGRLNNWGGKLIFYSKKGRKTMLALLPMFITTNYITS